LLTIIWTSKVVQNRAKLCAQNILRVQAPQNVYPNFHPCLATHHVDKFSKVIPTGAKVIRSNTRNCAPIFEILLFPFFLRDTPILGLNLLSSTSFPSFDCFATIDRGGSEILYLNQLSPKLFLGKAPHLGPILSKCAHLQSCVKVSRRLAEEARRYSSAKCQKKTQ